MGPFHANNIFGRHLGRHLVANKLSNDEMVHIIEFHNLLTRKEHFGIKTSIKWVHFMKIHVWPPSCTPS